VIPVEGDGDCFKIIQVENASLSDLTMVFLAALEGFTVPAGTVILISSVSHLAAVGTAAYAEDLVGLQGYQGGVHEWDQCTARYPPPVEWC
jgi:hypothetical protein